VLVVAWASDSGNNIPSKAIAGSRLVASANMFDTEYTVRRLSGQEFEVTKFSTRKEPDKVYRVRHNAKGDSWTCSCPGNFRYVNKPDKHSQFVINWIQNGEPCLFFHQGDL
jgi:hypothetical protein